MTPPRPIYADLVPGRVVLRQGDCLHGLRRLPDACVDSIVTDPPYGMSENPAPFADVLQAWLAGQEFVRGGTGIKKNTWDAEVPGPAIWEQCLRVLKPGGHLVAFSSARTAYRATTAIALAGFEIRNTLAWIHADGGGAYNHDIDQRFEKLITTGRSSRAPGVKPEGKVWTKNTGGKVPVTQPEAMAWSGWGTGLKPAQEPILLARKPMVGSYIPNLRAYGTGALNIDACRVDDGTMARHPANVIHDGSPDVLHGFPGDRAGFFFCPKPRGEDRAGSGHDTVKPVDLMRWLCRLVTPPGGVVLDPFAGSGTTGVAIDAEGFYGMLIERETRYCEDILRRFSKPAIPPAIGAKPRKARKAKTAVSGTEHLPGQGDLFGA